MKVVACACLGAAVFFAACSSGIGLCDPATQSNTQCCLRTCDNDQPAEPICVGGQWQCAATDVSREQCGSPFCLGALPRSSLALCVDRDAGMCLGCPAGETCFTQVICNPDPDGGLACNTTRPGPGDDRCHATCGSSADCSPTESCVHPEFFACDDVGQTTSICCGADAGC